MNRKIFNLIALMVMAITVLSGCRPEQAEHVPGNDGAPHCEIYYIDTLSLIHI